MVDLKPPRVFIVQQPMRYDDSQGCYTPKFPGMLNAAQAFGDVILLTPTGSGGMADIELLAGMRKHLLDYQLTDFLLLCGSPLLMAWAAVLAGANTGGKLNFLVWPNMRHPKAGTYIPLSVDLSAPTDIYSYKPA